MPRLSKYDTKVKIVNDLLRGKRAGGQKFTDAKLKVRDYATALAIVTGGQLIVDASSAAAKKAYASYQKRKDEREKSLAGRAGGKGSGTGGAGRG